MELAVTRLPPAARIVEVGPRDGLQNNSRTISTATKLEYIRLLADAGLRDIEVTSFVHPKWVPQLADAEELAAQLPQVAGLRYSALVPNLKGLERALQTGIRRVAIFTAASETFNRKNVNMSISESIDGFRPVMALASRNDISVRGYVSTCFFCPYEGQIAKEPVARVTKALFDLGVDEVSIGDTIGKASPVDVENTVGYLLQQFSVDRLAMHFHDTYGMAVANVFQSLKMGITVFDSSTGGIGGCPYAPGATGNVATERLVFLLDRIGVHTGVSPVMLEDAARFIKSAAH
jgi:hydroxymethylglutaryl-CoA lyase